jgi:hypothetical protein
LKGGADGCAVRVPVQRDGSVVRIKNVRRYFRRRQGCSRLGWTNPRDKYPR